MTIIPLWTQKVLCAVLSCSVMSDSLQPRGLQPVRLLCPWGFSRQRYRSGLPCPPSGDLPNPGITTRSPILWQKFYHLSHQRSPRILEWVAYPFPRGSSQPKNQTRVSCITGGFFTSWATREAQKILYVWAICNLLKPFSLISHLFASMWSLMNKRF